MLAAFGRTVVPPSLSETPPAPHPTGFAPQLVERYYLVAKHGEPNGSLRLVPRYRGVRYVPGGSSLAGYEGWGLLELPRSSSNDAAWLHLTLDIRDPMTACDTLACAGAISTGSKGTLRTLRFSDLHLRYAVDSVRLLDAYDGSLDGVSYTDPYGTDPRAADAPDAVWQYLRPGLDASIDGFFASEDAWRGLYLRDLHPEGLEPEDGLLDN